MRLYPSKYSLLAVILNTTSHCERPHRVHEALLDLLRDAAAVALLRDAPRGRLSRAH